MLKSKIQRESVKYNFLKRILVRFDYEGISEAELDNKLASIKEFLQDKQYSDFDNFFSNTIDIQLELQDPDISSLQNLPIKDKRQIKEFVFSDKKSNKEIHISNSYAYLSICDTKYHSFKKYFDEVYNVFLIIVKDIKFLKFKRFGIRKINQCLLVNFANLNKYFSKDYFSILHTDETFKTCDLKEFYKDGDFNINLGRAINTGEFISEDNKSQNVHQVIIDSDIYVYPNTKDYTDFECNAITMNDKLFELYKNLLTEDFLNSLCKDEFSNKDIIGVESNDN